MCLSFIHNESRMQLDTLLWVVNEKGEIAAVLAK
jgi:hypothetical protein